MQHLIDCMINPVDIVKNWNSTNIILPNAVSSSPQAIPRKSAAESQREQQEIRKRHLKQQLLKK